MGCLIVQYTGPLLALLANLGFVLMDMTAQHCIKGGVTPGQVAFTRMAMTLPIVAIYLIIAHPEKLSQLDPRSPTPSDPSLPSHTSTVEPHAEDNLMQRNPALAARLIWLRSVLTTLELCLLYTALAHIQLAEFTTVFMTKAFLVGFLCWVLLKEAFGWRLQIAAVLSTISVVLIVQPTFLFGTPLHADSSSRTLGFLLTLGCLVLDTLELVVLRKIGSGPDPLVMMLAYAMTCVIISPCFILFTGDTMETGTQGLGTILEMCFIAFTGLIAQVFLVNSMQREYGATVAVIAYSQIPMTIFVQSFIVGVVPDIMEGTGMFVILVAGVWAVVAESNERQLAEEMAQRSAEGYALLSPEEQANEEMKVEQDSICDQLRRKFGRQSDAVQTVQSV